MENTNVMKLMEASNENFYRKTSGEFSSTIIFLQGMVVEMFGTLENINDLEANLHTAGKTFHYPVDMENVEALVTLAQYKSSKNEIKSGQLAA